MRLGYNTAILPEASLEEVLKIASGIGYDSVEVMCWPPGKATRRYAGVTHINVLDLDDAACDKIKRLCTENDVTISGLGYYPNALSRDADEAKQAVEHLFAVIDGASKLGIGVVNSFIGRDWKKSVDDNWPRFLETWRPIIAHAEQRDVKIGIENCPMLFGPDEWPGGKNLAHCPAIWQRMFDDIPSDHFGLNYDPSHMIFQQMDYLSPIREFGDKLFHVHAKDVRVDQYRLDRIGILAYPNDYHTPKLPGMGDVDWGKFFSALTDSGFNGDVSVEVEDRSYEATEKTRCDALRQSHTYLRNFVPCRP
tara:strand:- start:48764 stop:49687 length:924 start_codon:yes stop_codon:yes gene_type:complete